MNLNLLDFEFPWVLTAFIPLAFVLWYHWRDPGASVRFPSLKGFETNRRFSLKRRLTLILTASALLLLTLSLAGPRKRTGEIVRRADGVDLLIAIDLSGSMTAYDAPKSARSLADVERGIRTQKILPRIEVSKAEIRRFIDMRPNDRIGLIAFAEQAFAVCPPTLDHAWLDKQVENLKLHTIGDGTGIASPIAAAVERLKSSDAKRKTLVLFTDGKNTAVNKLTPLQAARIAKDYNIVIHTVGIGSKQAFVTQQVWGQTRLARYEDEFDENVLREMAKITGGQYYTAEDADGMRKAMDDIDKLETQTRELPVHVLRDELAPDLAALAALFLLGAFILSNTLFLRYP